MTHLNTTVTASYSKKLNHKLYGGGDYENSDHFCSMSAEVGDEDPEEVYDELYNACVNAVHKSIAAELDSWTGELSLHDSLQWITDYLNDKDVQGEQYERMSKHHKDIIQEIKKRKKREDYKLNKLQ